MRILLPTLSALLLALLLTGIEHVAPAAETARPIAAAPAPHARGLLWKIERRGAPPSHLFGTIHLADPRVTKLAPPVSRAFDEAQHFVMELVPDAGGIAELAQAMMFTDGRTLRNAIGASLYAETEAAFRRRGLPTLALDQYKPWAAAVILSLPNPSEGVPLDLQLQLKATQQKKTVEGLETAQEQIAVFNDLSPDDQRALLQATLREQAGLERQIEAMVQAYVDRDLARLRALANEHAPDDRALHETVMQRLLASRNRRMVERMRPRLQQGNAFIAVGAAHLNGPDGLLKLLERGGYRVGAVY